MQKRKRWQFFLIIIVLVLTVYNILPTVFYYTKPLKEDVNASQAKKVALSITQRVNALERQSLDWTNSYCKLLKISPKTIKLDPSTPQFIEVTFKKKTDALTFRKFFQRAGALIPFVPSQLSLSPQDADLDPNKVIIQRQIPVHLKTNEIDQYFQFSYKTDAAHKMAPLYQKVFFDRVSQIGLSLAGTSDSAQAVATIISQPNNPATQDQLFSAAQEILDVTNLLGENSPITARYFANFSQGLARPEQSLQALVSVYDSAINQLKSELKELQNKEEKQRSEKTFIDDDIRQQMHLVEKRETLLVNATAIIKKHSKTFRSGQTPYTYETIHNQLKQSYQEDPISENFGLKIGLKNPFIDKITVDWSNNQLLLQLHPDVTSLKTSSDASKRDLIDRLIINEVAKTTNISGEHISIKNDEYAIHLEQLTGSKSFLLFDLSQIAKTQAEQVKHLLDQYWHTSHPELTREAFPIWDFTTYQNLPEHEKKIGLVIYAPILHAPTPPSGMKNGSIYVIAKGLDRIFNKYQSESNSTLAKQFFEDFQNLQKILRQNKFLGYPGASLRQSSEFAQDFLFEKEDYYQTLLAATRENFQVHGTKRYATLEFTNYEQRLLTLNKIETCIHEDLLKWKDEFQAAQVSLDPRAKFEVPAPVQSPLWSNWVLSFKKYFRGDDRKILHWGLDLSGGKSVQIELRDKNNKLVKNETDIKQGINELYARVNKMGVSEVNIRQVDTNIALDFPGSQGLSAKELIKASTMYFHVVNEQFSTRNRNLVEHINRFLQDVWNEAVVTNKKDIESINLIARKHLYGESAGEDLFQPRTESAKILFENGLRLASIDSESNTLFNDSLSKIAIMRGNDAIKWEGQTNPLLIVFNNYALEGSNLTNILSSFDPSKGNYLSFEVKGSYTTADHQKLHPREDLFEWTSHFSKTKITGTSLETYSPRGWRMAVILNDSIISSPNLEEPLRDHAMIRGSFSQREVNQLAADLKAGSLSFTPRILSEKNVSPELGQKERLHGIVATFVSLLLVVIAMISYYRFSGIIASVAVILNLLIMWAALQNIQATLTLAGIAGIILTVGMAVDANVLVFERIKEEFKISNRIASAVNTGYRKAFSAIFDSNLTTIMAALILLHFDSGPIKGFAITLIIGIASSMFTALFMTRQFFSKWVENPKHNILKMSDFIKSSGYNFLKYSKYVMFSSLLIILVGGFFLISQRHSIFGMDFTGGFSLTVELQEKAGTDYRQAVEEALYAKGAAKADFQVRPLNTPNQLRILFGTHMENEGQPFFGMPLESNLKETQYLFEKNPRIEWIVSALNNKGMQLQQSSLQKLDSTWTSMSGQISDQMRNNALWGLLLALFFIFIYIAFRFEFSFASSAMLCLIHDVLITLSVIALLHLIGVPVMIDLHTVAALMTIIGYSLNDTIIIFDRIREDSKSLRKLKYKEIINHSLNVTLSRTTITSMTTLIALFALVVLGGSTIFNFAFVMLLGVIFGTFSSLFIASPLMLFFRKLELKKQNDITIKDTK